MDNRTFQYRPLKSGQIRILKRRPTKHLAFNFHTVALKNPPKYAALSYRWGDPDLCHAITIDGATFWITDSLHQALVQLDQGIWLEDKTVPFRRSVWIDAICINQSKEAGLELNMQVQRMTEIYDNAERIYVWLGPAANEEDNRLAAFKMRDIQRQFLRGSARALGGYKPWWWPRAPLDSVSTELRISRDIGHREASLWAADPDSARSAWRGIVHVWKSQWWTRAWAYQEATVVEKNESIYLKGTNPGPTKTRIRFICGSMYTTWADLSHTFASTGPLIDSKLPGTEIIRGSALHYNRVAQIRAWRRSDEPIDMLEALNSFRLAACTNPRDKVYAVLGCVRSQSHEQFTVDYQQTVVEVYVGVARHLATTGLKSLDFLGYAVEIHNADACLQSKDIIWKDLPSWAPNWDLPLEVNPLPKTLSIQAPVPKKELGTLTIDRRMQTFSRTVERRQTYSACGHFNESDIKITLSQLISSGVHVDTVQETMRFSWAKDVRTATVTRWKSVLACSRYANGADFDRDLRRVHCGDVRYELIPRHTPVARGYEINNQLLFHDPLDLSDSERRSQATMLSTLRKTTRQRALCLTTDNRLALVPYMSQKGDKICMLFGGQVLYVLRPVDPIGRIYRYVGEAYLHDMMDGQVSDMCDAGHLQVRQFVVE